MGLEAQNIFHFLVYYFINVRMLIIFPAPLSIIEGGVSL